MINYDEREERLRETLRWMAAAMRPLIRGEMVVIWDHESTDIIPDPQRHQWLIEDCMKLVTEN